MGALQLCDLGPQGGDRRSQQPLGEGPASRAHLQHPLPLLKPGGGHTSHIHPHAFLSGTVYIDVPDGASALKLEDPRLPFMMARPGLTDDAPEAERPFVYLRPQAGTVLMWESWLRHEVPPNAAKSERISVSFNYA